MKRGVTRNVQLQPRSASGARIPTALNASALRDAYGNIIGAIGIPSSPGHAFLEKFTIVIRATVKGNVVVAALQ